MKIKSYICKFSAAASAKNIKQWLLYLISLRKTQIKLYVFKFTTVLPAASPAKNIK